MFSCEFYEIFKNSIFYGTLSVTASGLSNTVMQNKNKGKKKEKNKTTQSWHFIPTSHMKVVSFNVSIVSLAALHLLKRGTT